MLKLSDNPPMRSPRASASFEVPGTWYIAHTKARFEKAFAWDLYDRDIDYFLPLLQKTTITSGKRRKVMKPLFPSYVFFCGDADARYRALLTDRLCQVIPVSDQAQLINELSSIDRALAGSGELDLYPMPAIGTRCRVNAGPLLGIEGIVVEQRERVRMVLQVSMLGRGASLEIEADMLESLESTEPIGTEQSREQSRDQGNLASR